MCENNSSVVLYIDLGKVILVKRLCVEHLNLLSSSLKLFNVVISAVAGKLPCDGNCEDELLGYNVKVE